MRTDPIRVFILDDHELVRRGLRDVIAVEDDLEVVGEASSARGIVDEIERVRPDVAVLDVRLQEGDGIEVCREIRSRHPNVRCFMLSSFADDDLVYGSVLAGASGYLLKGARVSELVDGIRKVAQGLSLLDPALTANLLERLRNPQGQASRNLTPQEEKILNLIAEGLTNHEIAEHMFLAEQTVKNYVSSILAKLGIKRRTQAAVFAVQGGKRQEPDTG